MKFIGLIQRNLFPLLPFKIRRLIRTVFTPIIIKRWIKNGKPHPPPHAVKVKRIVSMAKRRNIEILVETGTYLGETIDSTREHFRKVYSIELNKKLYERARKIFGKYENVHLIEGDSAEKLSTILEKLDEPAIFWFDAHYSGKGTSKSSVDTPILSEVEIVMNYLLKGSVILIDDARFFTGKNGYPKLEEFKKDIIIKYPQVNIEVKDDIIHIVFDSNLDQMAGR